MRSQGKSTCRSDIDSTFETCCQSMNVVNAFATLLALSPSLGSPHTSTVFRIGDTWFRTWELLNARDESPVIVALISMALKSGERSRGAVTEVGGSASLEQNA